MTFRSAWLVFLVAACGGSSAAAPEATEPVKNTGPEIPKDLVRLYLLADTSAITPGLEFSLAARLDVEPSWHIYWTNPGESGLPTTATFEVPSGFSTKPVRFPGPKSFDGGGGVQNYGYEDLVLLSTSVTAPEALKPNEKLEFKAKAEWLACREMCIPGEAETTLYLESVGESVPVSPSNAAMFDAHQSALPTPWVDGLGEFSWRAEQRALEIKIPNATGAEYFPSPDEQTLVSGVVTAPGDGAVALIVSYNKDEVFARGVLAIDTADGRKFHQLNWEREK